VTTGQNHQCQHKQHHRRKHQGRCRK
jgi:hypothetical protein